MVFLSANLFSLDGPTGSLNPTGSKNLYSAVNSGNIYSENPSQFQPNIGQQPINYSAGHQFGTSPQNQVFYDRLHQGTQGQGQPVSQDQFRHLYDHLRMGQTNLPPQQNFLSVNQNYGPQNTQHLSGDYMSMHDPREVFRTTQENPYESIPALRLNKTAPADMNSATQPPQQPKVKKLPPMSPPELPPRNPHRAENFEQISNQVNAAQQQNIVKEGKENNEDEIVANSQETIKEAVDAKAGKVPDDPVLPARDYVADNAVNPGVSNKNEVKIIKEEKPVQPNRTAPPAKDEQGRIATVGQCYKVVFSLMDESEKIFIYLHRIKLSIVEYKVAFQTALYKEKDRRNHYLV